MGVLLARSVPQHVRLVPTVPLATRLGPFRYRYVRLCVRTVLVHRVNSRYRHLARYGPHESTKNLVRRALLRLERLGESMAALPTRLPALSCAFFPARTVGTLHHCPRLRSGPSTRVEQHDYAPVLRCG